MEVVLTPDGSFKMLLPLPVIGDGKSAQRQRTHLAPQGEDE